MSQVNASKSKKAVSAKSALDFINLLFKLKTTKRTGWVLKGVKQPESIADHMYRMSMMAMLACQSEPGLDINRCVKMSLVHDVAESIVGDFTPHCPVSKEEKFRLERDAIAQIRNLLRGEAEDETQPEPGVAREEEKSNPESTGPVPGVEDDDLGREVERLWLEYEEGCTPEALLVKDLDKLEMVAQACEYEGEQADLDLEDFFRSTAGKFTTETGKAWAAEIVRRRQALLRRRQADGAAAEGGKRALEGAGDAADGQSKEQRTQ